MNLIKIIIPVILVAFFSSCRVRNKPATHNENQGIDTEQSDYEGLEKGMISHRPENIEACRWFILLEDGRLLEPIDLPEEFKKDSLNIWVGYMVQKRPSRCLEAMPVGISEIRKKGD
ncbi:MAG: hypothetical protein JXA03_07615 [Bacteroidales bacterium]|nr:hypothetical protein [Bacteroidales bacterium]